MSAIQQLLAAAQVVVVTAPVDGRVLMAQSISGRITYLRYVRPAALGLLDENSAAILDENSLAITES